MTADRAADAPGTDRSGHGRSLWSIVLGAALAVAFVGFIALGVWQLQRMAWKQALIERVDARVAAEPVAPPPRAAWAGVSEEGDAYRRVVLSGRFVDAPEVRTQAVTALGAGHWVMTPLRTDGGDIVLVNRGFVPQGAEAAPPPAGAVTIIGLLRISEPVGGFLRHNDPAAGRWYSRDVAAIARAHALPAADVAPYFVDAFSTAGPGVTTDARWPRAGMTVVRFRDSHLSYALTWFGMALLTAFATWRLVVSGRRFRQDRRPRGDFHHAGAIPHR